MISGVKHTVNIVGEFDAAEFECIIEHPVDYEDGFVSLKVHYGSEEEIEGVEHKETTLVFTVEQAREIAEQILNLVRDVA